MSNRSKESPLPKLNQSFNSKYNIALVHGSLQIPSKSQEDDFPITLEEIGNSGFNYIALGHWHSFQEISKNPHTYYSGSPEQLKYSEKDSGNVLMVELNENQIKVDKIKIGEIKWEEIELYLDKFKNSSEVLREVENYKGEQNILKVRFKGNQKLSNNQDIAKLKEVLEDQFLHLEFEQKSPVIGDELSSSKFPLHTVTGQFLQIMEERIATAEEGEKEKYQEAKNLGYLLLSGKIQDVS